MGKIQYYTNFKQSNSVCIKLETIRPIDANSYFGVWRILEYLVGEPSDAGHDDNLQVGMQVSGNEFNGAGVRGMATYLVQRKNQLIRKIFSKTL